MTRTTRHLLRQKKEHGSVLGLAAVSMAALLLAVGLCIDVGHWYLVAGELQNAADASALAAVTSLDGTQYGIAQAAQRAAATANKYEFNGKDVLIDAATNVLFAAQLSEFDTGTAHNAAYFTASPGAAAAIRFVKVTMPPTAVPVFFATLATQSNNVDLSRSAVAGLSVDLNTFGNIVPLAIVETTTGQLTSGNQYTFTVNNGTGTTYPVGGEYLILDLTSTRNNSGATNPSLRELLAIGSDGYVTSGQTIPVRTGNKAGQIRDGLNSRFGDYGGGGTDFNELLFPPDANVKEGITRADYRNPGACCFLAPPSGIGVWDRRVMVLPIITPSQFYPDSSQPTIKPTRFGAFFMTSRASNGQSDLYLEYIGTPAVIGNGGFDPNGGAGTPNVSAAVLYR
ncbi:MAG: pilus assembly protein TadG-related protein [Blastocatellia bacterium]